MLGRFLLACWIALLAGCGRHPATAPAAEAPLDARPADSAAAETAADRISAVLDELTQAVRKYGAEQQRVPKNLDELVAAGYLSHVPEAPTGKRFAIDRNMKVYLADR